MLRAIIGGILATYLFAAGLGADEVPKEEKEMVHPAKRLTAIRAERAPRIDGKLDDDVWQSAPTSGDFVQREPREKQGEPATEKTTVQAAYDDEALYVGVMCYDSEPEKIVSLLTRRDNDSESDDRVSLDLDPHHDHTTGYWFNVHASGTLSDGFHASESQPEHSWNGVWEAKVAKLDNGWSIEYRIPYHVIRFTRQEEYVWGIQVQRWIARKKERDQWVLLPDGQSGWISHIGHLEGIRGIHPPNHLEFIPYTRARSILSPKTPLNTDGRELSAALGGDVRYGVTSNISLNATINPDFGQVEADPAQLNLTVFETFFDERRPFFVEGGGLFATHWVDIVGIGSPYRLFYSRRIGKNPGYFQTPGGANVLETPDQTTILGAAKVTGKTSGKTSFSIIEALTQEEFARIDTPTTNPATGVQEFRRQDFRIEPATNFLIGKVQQDFANNSNVSATVTSVNRVGAPPALTGGLDSHLVTKNKDYNLILRAATSQTGALDDRKSGYAGQAYFYKFSGWFGGQVFTDYHSKNFNVNDLGFMERPGVLRVGGHAYAQRQKPWLLARRSHFNINTWSNWNDDGINVTKGLNLNNGNHLKSYGFAGWGLSREWEAKDDLNTRGGPVMVKPAMWWGWFSLGSDESKAVAAFIFGNWGQKERNAGYWRRVGMNFTIRPSSNVQINFGPGFGRDKNTPQWVTNVDENGDGAHDRFIFGDLISETLDLTTRADISFSPTLTLQAYVQPFVAVGDFGDIKALARPDSFEFVPYDQPLGFSPDFHNRSLRGNVVLRWEYHPGSAFYAVWSQNRSAAPTANNPTLEAFDNLQSSFTDDGQNVFLVKMDYWLGM